LRRRLPHVRGCVSNWYKFGGYINPYSPLTWGCFLVLDRKSCSVRVFPTYVGVFLIKCWSLLSMTGLPHACGGVSQVIGDKLEISQSSPRTWGCFRHQRPPAKPDLVFPTYVGVFPGKLSGRKPRLSLPHARGGVS